MVFSSTIFLFLFLPIVLFGNALIPKGLRNAFLCVASLFFYAWGEPELVWVMLLSICINYAVGILIERKKSSAKQVLFIGVTINLALLFFFKYVNFFLENISALFGHNQEDILQLHNVHLPIGISFFTFQGISYIVDVYRKDANAETNLINTGLYISLFPQLIAGPIVRYNTVMDQIKNRSANLDDVQLGVKRFIIGLSKKVLIANSLGQIADTIFASSYDQLPTEAAWLGIICYTLQIYFDFSGYSDMAIGLGRILGFKFEENFRFPYSAKSIQSFWRKWHISLSTWFRDYLYIPLGGNRKGAKRTYLNLFIVFLLTGFWHGASWSFIFWGLFHGAFLIIERIGFDRILSKLFFPLQWLYTMFIVIIGWVFFRVDHITDAWDYLGSMFHISTTNVSFEWFQYLNNYTIMMLLVGIVLSFNVNSLVEALEKRIHMTSNAIYIEIKQIVGYLLLIILLLFCASEVANNTYNPFIYYRF